MWEWLVEPGVLDPWNNSWMNRNWIFYFRSVIKTGDVVRDYFICDKVYLGKFGVETVSEKVDGGGAFSLQLYPTNNEISRVAAEKKVLCGQLLTGFRHCTQFNERFSFGDYYVIGTIFDVTSFQIIFHFQFLMKCSRWKLIWRSITSRSLAPVTSGHRVRYAQRSSSYSSTGRYA